MRSKDLPSFGKRSSRCGLATCVMILKILKEISNALLRLDDDPRAQESAGTAEDLQRFKAEQIRFCTVSMILDEAAIFLTTSLH